MSGRKREYIMQHDQKYRDKITRNYILPDKISAEEFKQIRKKYHMTQREFAKLLHVSKPTIERWESGKTKITGPAIIVLDVLQRNDNYVDEITLPEKNMPLRLFYMYKSRVCTLIDVDEMNQKVKIRNYTNNVLFRAFGIIEEPTYKDYQEFLESRCFPRGRDKMKLILKDLNLPFYDPLMIIEKTEGRMAEDDFWIRIER